MNIMIRLFFVVIISSSVLSDDLGFLSCGEVTFRPVKWDDWYVVMGLDGVIHGNDYIFDFLVDADAKFTFVRIDEEKPLFYITMNRNGQQRFVYMTDRPDKRVESVDSIPGPEGQWNITRVVNGKYTLSTEAQPNWRMCMNDDYRGTIIGCEDEIGPKEIFNVQNW
ncbi:Hypothetical predicted protein [Mytilus galloprovincialis]|uniref:Uncharacterized protein n=2 Tax=Mytilus galloprovincialis TaxID=29158 RepID=A0A8B6E0A3_MYTGA|nr:Hypothetical predicted protein [Mytilus galloprovincialis]